MRLTSSLQDLILLKLHSSNKAEQSVFQTLIALEMYTDIAIYVPSVHDYILIMVNILATYKINACKLKCIIIHFSSLVFSKFISLVLELY